MPELSELHREIVPKCAARWRDLGVELKIPVDRLDIIAVNHTNHPSYSEQCCKAVLKKWMETTPNHTWTVLQKAVDGVFGLSYEVSSESKRDIIIMNSCFILLNHLHAGHRPICAQFLEITFVHDMCMCV